MAPPLTMMSLLDRKMKQTPTMAKEANEATSTTVPATVEHEVEDIFAEVATHNEHAEPSEGRRAISIGGFVLLQLGMVLSGMC